MKRIELLALALLMLGSAALAQTVRNDGSGLGAGSMGTGSTPNPIMPTMVGGLSRTDSVSRALTFDTSNNVMVTQYLPGYANLLYDPLIVNDTLSVSGATSFAWDSSTVRPVGNYHYLALAIKLEPGAGALPADVSLGIIPQWMTSAAFDTLNTFTDSPILLWNNAGADSIGYGDNTDATDVGVNYSWEQVVPFRMTSALGSREVYRTKSIRLENWGYPYLRIKYRLLGSAGATVRVKMDLVGRSQ